MSFYKKGTSYHFTSPITSSAFCSYSHLRSSDSKSHSRFGDFKEVYGMKNLKKSVKTLSALFIIYMPFLMMPPILFAGTTLKKQEMRSQSQTDYVLEVEGNDISLKAKDASIKEILEDIGRRMKIEVVVNIPKEKKITVELDMMYLGDAIKRLRTDYAYITESEKDKGKITKIVVVPKGQGMMPILSQKNSVVKKEKRRKIRYNPQPSLKPTDVSDEKSMVDTEVKERTLDSSPKPPARTYEATKVKKSVESKIRSTEDKGTEAPSHSEPLTSDYNPQPSTQ
jgi:hypothetical protein